MQLLAKSYAMLLVEKATILLTCLMKKQGQKLTNTEAIGHGALLIGLIPSHFSQWPLVFLPVFQKGRDIEAS
jgi:hypothetical protein